MSRPAYSADDAPLFAPPGQGAAFVLSCFNCDAGDWLTSPAHATQAGWKDLTPDPAGWSWTWLGWCPVCNARTQWST